MGEFAYLEPNFNPHDVDAPRLRNILMTNEIAYPSGANKTKLVALFYMHIVPQIDALRAKYLNVKRSDVGIEDVKTGRIGTGASDATSRSKRVPFVNDDKKQEFIAVEKDRRYDLEKRGVIPGMTKIPEPSGSSHRPRNGGAVAGTTTNRQYGGLSMPSQISSDGINAGATAAYQRVKERRLTNDTPASTSYPRRPWRQLSSENPTPPPSTRQDAGTENNIRIADLEQTIKNQNRIIAKLQVDVPMMMAKTRASEAATAKLEHEVKDQKRTIEKLEADAEKMAIKIEELRKMAGL